LIKPAAKVAISSEIATGGQCRGLVITGRVKSYAAVSQFACSLIFPLAKALKKGCVIWIKGVLVRRNQRFILSFLISPDRVAKYRTDLGQAYHHGVQVGSKFSYTHFCFSPQD
jgi:hypothetical protein